MKWYRWKFWKLARGCNPGGIVFENDGRILWKSINNSEYFWRVR